jgi:hypothetical protein
MVANELVAGCGCQDSSVNDRATRRLVGAVALGAALSACSSTGSSPASPANTVAPPSTAPIAAPSRIAADPAQIYLDAVNARCDALLPKIVAVTHGGSIDVPVREYLATWPAHERLLEGFDAHVATIAVPAAAQAKAAVLTAYVHFADRLDAARLAAARKGQAAYTKEVRSESGVENDPTIAALGAAGFNNSCTAR